MLVINTNISSLGSYGKIEPEFIIDTCFKMYMREYKWGLRKKVKAPEKETFTFFKSEEFLKEYLNRHKEPDHFVIFEVYKTISNPLLATIR